MTTRFVDPDRFVLLASVVDWRTVSRRFGQSAPASQIAEQRRIKTRMVQLRWSLSPEVGLPTEPFEVWRRPALPAPGEKPVTVVTLNPVPGWRLHVLPFDAALVRARFNVLSGNAIVMAVAQPNLFSSPLDVQTFAPGIRTSLFAGPTIRALAVFGDADLQQVVATTTDQVAELNAGWELMEIVGMPVDQADWSGVFGHDKPQGLVSSLSDPASAARDRWRRGAPFYGWDVALVPGEPAPVWKLADPNAMIKVAQSDVLPELKKMLQTLPPPQHISLQIDHVLTAANGRSTAKAKVRPLADLAYAATTDPLASLILGYGTAFEDVDLPQVILSDRVLLGDSMRSDYDFMVTASWSKGLDGESQPVELAALALAPGSGTRPPKPANLQARLRGLRPPDVPDGPFGMTADIEWARPPQAAIGRAVSYATARRFLFGGITTPLLSPRKLDDALQTVGVSASAERIGQGLGPLAGDGGHQLASIPQPNTLRYGAAHQDLFGVWSEWSTTTLVASEPTVQLVTIISARMETQRPASGAVCPTKLVIDFSWDWSSRRPLAIEFRGRFFAQPKRDAAPTNTTVPAGLDRAFPGGGPPFVLTFDASGEVSSSGTILHLSEDGMEILSGAAAPSTVAGPRRYRLTIDSMSIDHGLAGHVGLSLWARGRERAGVQRLGAFGPRPKVASSSDPRPPVMTGEREDVLMASMPDGKREHRAKLSWPAYEGAIGYFVYHAEESKIRTVNELGDAPRHLTLSDRLAALRTAFQNNPDKRAFSRLNSTALTGRDFEVILPRGSKEIHLYLVVGVGAGGVETDWPTSADPSCGKRAFAFAAPQISIPSPPELEVARAVVKDPDPPTHLARVMMRARPGVVASEIHLHRVRNPEAALNVDTMGPPVAKITGSTAQWMVSPRAGIKPGESQPLAFISGFDPVPGSWKPVFYRAVAWSSDDPERGVYGGRSQPSSVQQVIVPPASGPDVSSISMSWPGGPIGNVLATATIHAPLQATQLGIHRIRAEALIADSDEKFTPTTVFPAPPLTPGDAIDDRLEALPTAPPAGSGSAIWRTPLPEDEEGCIVNVRISRPAFDIPARVRILVVDPLGRATEREVAAPQTSPLPAPDLSDLVIASATLSTATLAFSTAIRPASTPLGSYILKVVFRPIRPFVFPPLSLRILSLTIALDSVRPLQPGESLGLDPAEIPLRLVPAAGRRTGLLALLRGARGTAQITLTAPDGRVATSSIRL